MALTERRAAVEHVLEALVLVVAAEDPPLEARLQEPLRDVLVASSAIHLPWTKMPSSSIDVPASSIVITFRAIRMEPSTGKKKKKKKKIVELCS